MAKQAFKSEFKFEKVKLKNVKLSSPVCVVMEWNDGYHTVMLENRYTRKLEEQDPSDTYISCKHYDSLQEFIEDEGDYEDMSPEDALKSMYKPDSNVSSRSIIKVIKLTGKYHDPQNIIYP